VTRPVVVVVGLGPADADLMTAGTRRVLDATPTERLFLRTRVHPAANTIDRAVRSFDDIYEREESFEHVYGAIVEALVNAAVASAPGDETVYAVPGSPVVAEHTVELLLRDPRVEVRVEPALSFLDLAWARLRIDPLAAGVRLIDGHRFGEDAAALTGAALVAQCHSRDVLSDIKLAIDTAMLDEVPVVTVLHHLGLPDERIVAVAWNDLDRLESTVGIEADHLTSLYVPAMVSSTGRAIVRLEEQMRALRERCPWDAEQTHQTLARYAIEEAQELAEAIDQLAQVDVADGDPDPDPEGHDPVDHLEEELGDLLFQVVFHSCLATEKGWFTLADVATTLHAKMERRHPHVFGDVVVGGVEDVKRNWETIKAAERAARQAR
jgi:tetrapyrrole methylase family protein / MazG family protein